MAQEVRPTTARRMVIRLLRPITDNFDIPVYNDRCKDELEEAVRNLSPHHKMRFLSSILLHEDVCRYTDDIRTIVAARESPQELIDFFLATAARAIADEVMTRHGYVPDELLPEGGPAYKTSEEAAFKRLATLKHLEERATKHQSSYKA